MGVPPGKISCRERGCGFSCFYVLLNYQNVQEIKIGLAENKIRELQLLS